ncbi:MAG: hypothetical protein ACKOXQ_07830 [Hydrogenophaga sp.]
MESLSIWHWMVVALVVLMGLGAAGVVTGRTGALVVKQFFVSATPRDDGVYVEVIARRAGVLAWLLSLLRVDPLVEMRIRYSRVEYFSGSLSGFHRVVLPIESVSSVFFGVSRPWLKAVLWFLAFVVMALGAAEAGSTLGVVVLVLLGAAVAVLVMVLGRQRVIGLTEMTGDEYALRVKRSVIEGQEIDEARLEEVSRIVLALLDAHQFKTRG